MARNRDELNRAYNIACAQLGQAIYKISALEAEAEAAQKETEQLKRDLKYLNAEAARLESKQPEAEPAIEPLPASAPITEASNAGHE